MLMCLLLLLSLTSCNKVGNKYSNQKLLGDEMNNELDAFLRKMQNESLKNEKINFHVEYQDLHYKLKEVGSYNDDYWLNSAIIVTVECNYDLAVDEDWYKKCNDIDVKTLNMAFFDQYSAELSVGHFSSLGTLPALHFVYNHSETTLSKILSEFYEDFKIFKIMCDLKYVESINITYQYSVPSGYFDE